MATVNMIKANCPECGLEVDAATGVGKDKAPFPTPGDIAICIRCAGIGIYVLSEDGVLGLRLATYDEKVLLSENDELTGVRAAIIGQSIWFNE